MSFFLYYVSCDALMPNDQSLISRGTKCSLFFLFFFLKVVHHIHGWRVGKLQTCFSKDTGCRNQSTLTMTCECLEFPCTYFSAIWKRHLLISQQSNSLRLCSETRTNHFQTKLHNSHQSQEWPSRLLITLNYRSTDLVQPLI